MPEMIDVNFQTHKGTFQLKAPAVPTVGDDFLLVQAGTRHKWVVSQIVWVSNGTGEASCTAVCSISMELNGL